jgi:hypothetical protein
LDFNHSGRARQLRIAALADPLNARSWYARSRAKVATGLLLTAPGVPMIFMGQEFLEDKYWTDWPGRPELLIWWDGLEGKDRHMSDQHRFTRDLMWLRRSPVRPGRSTQEVRKSTRVQHLWRSKSASFGSRPFTSRWPPLIYGVQLPAPDCESGGSRLPHQRAVNFSALRSDEGPRASDPQAAPQAFRKEVARWRRPIIRPGLERGSPGRVRTFGQGFFAAGLPPRRCGKSVLRPTFQSGAGALVSLGRCRQRSEKLLFQCRRLGPLRADWAHA